MATTTAGTKHAVVVAGYSINTGKDCALRGVRELLQRHEDLETSGLVLYAGSISGTKHPTAEDTAKQAGVEIGCITIDLTNTSGLVPVLQAYQCLKAGYHKYALVSVSERETCATILLKSFGSIVAGDQVGGIIDSCSFAKGQANIGSDQSWNLSRQMVEVLAFIGSMYLLGDFNSQPIKDGESRHLEAATTGAMTISINLHRPSNHLISIIKEGTKVGPTAVNASKVAFLFSLDSLPSSHVVTFLSQYPAFRNSYQQYTKLHPALAVQLSTYNLWTSWGVQPDFVLGIGLGEIVAAASQDLSSVEFFNTLLSSFHEPNVCSLIIRAKEQVVQEAVLLFGREVRIAATVKDVSVVIAANPESSRRFTSALADMEISCEPLDLLSFCNFDNSLTSELLHTTPVLETHSNKSLISGQLGEVIPLPLTVEYLHALLRAPTVVASTIDAAISQGVTTLITMNLDSVYVSMLQQSYGDRMSILPDILGSYGNIRASQREAVDHLLSIGRHVDPSAWAESKEVRDPIENALTKLWSRNHPEGAAASIPAPLVKPINGQKVDSSRNKPHEASDPVEMALEKLWSPKDPQQIATTASLPALATVTANENKNAPAPNTESNGPRPSHPDRVLEVGMHLHTMWTPESIPFPSPQLIEEFKARVPMVFVLCQKSIGRVEHDIIESLAMEGIPLRIGILNAGEGDRHHQVDYLDNNSITSFITAGPNVDIVVIAAHSLASDSDVDYETGCRPAVDIVHALQTHKRAKNRKISCFWLAEAGAPITPMDTVNYQIDARLSSRVSPGAAGLFGFLKVVRRELYKHSKHIAMDIAQLPSIKVLIQDVVSIHMSSSNTSPIAYQSDGTRLAPRLVEMPPTDMQKVVTLPIPTAIKAEFNGTWLVTGGLGDVGIEINKWLIERMGVRNIVLIGRSPIQKVQSRLAQLQALCNAIYISADVSTYDEMQTVFKAIISDPELPPLSGVIHGVAQWDDRLISKVTYDQIEYVMHAKAHGAHVLDQLTRPLQSIKHFILLSSITAAIPNPGQTAYTVGNYFADAMAVRRRKAGFPALSVQFGGIEGSKIVESAEQPVPGLTIWRVMTPKAALDILEVVLVKGIAYPIQAIAVFDKLAVENTPSCKDDPFFSWLQA